MSDPAQKVVPLSKPESRGDLLRELAKQADKNPGVFEELLILHRTPGNAPVLTSRGLTDLEIFGLLTISRTIIAAEEFGQET